MLSEGKKSRALKLYREIIVIEGEYKVNPLVVSMFFKHFRGLMKARILLREKQTSELQLFLNKNRLFYMKKHINTLAVKYKNITLLKALKQLSKIELGMKGAYCVRVSSTNIELEQIMVKYF